MFEINMTPAVITLLSVLVAGMGFAIISLRTRVHALARRAAARPKGEVQLPGASVVVYADDDEPNLEVLLPQLLGQNYPAPLEVIVVCDGTPGLSGEIVANLQREHPNLYMTHVPERSRNLSRKKMAVTLGVKAAKNEVVAMTCGQCVLCSPDWLATLLRPIARGRDISLGYARPVREDAVSPQEENGQPRFSKVPAGAAFDYLWSAVTYLYAALRGHACRGTECNLAYRRSLFFGNNGFSDHLNLNFGDDDIFISQISTADNTGVVLSPDSVVLNPSLHPAAAHRAWRMRYDFTRRYINTSAPAAMGAAVVAWWAVVGASVALSLAGLPSLLPLCVSVFLFLAAWTLLALTWGRAYAVFQTRSRRATLLAPLRMLWRPFYNLRYRMAERKCRESNFTWTRQGFER